MQRPILKRRQVSDLRRKIANGSDPRDTWFGSNSHLPKPGTANMAAGDRHHRGDVRLIIRTVFG